MAHQVPSLAFAATMCPEGSTILSHLDSPHLPQPQPATATKQLMKKPTTHLSWPDKSSPSALGLQKQGIWRVNIDAGDLRQEAVLCAAQEGKKLCSPCQSDLWGKSTSQPSGIAVNPAPLSTGGMSSPLKVLAR